MSESISRREYKELKLARGLFFHEGHVLLVKNNEAETKHFFLPGGRVDPRENVMEALVREYNEELGWHVDIEHFVGCIEHAWEFEKNSTGQIYDMFEINFLFTLKPIDRKLTLDEPKSLEEKLSFHWVKLTELENVTLYPQELKTLLPRIHSQISKGQLQPLWSSSLIASKSEH